MKKSLEDRIKDQYGDDALKLFTSLIGGKIPKEEALHLVCLRATARAGDVTLSDGQTRLTWDAPLNEPPPVVAVRRVQRINV